MTGCEKPVDPGFLHVAAANPGSYEIYRLTTESPLQLVSEQSGRFNETVALAPGSYLVLADCSSETVIVRPGETERLTAHRIRFTTPLDPDVNDQFHVQCSRGDETRSRQNITDRYELDVLEGKRDLLVGMVPMTVDLRDAGGEPSVRDFRLSAVQVTEAGLEASQASYFVSPADDLISITQPQSFGNWTFLLPGRYVLEVNGTRSPVELAAGETRKVQPAFLRVETSEHVDLKQGERVKGSPHLVEVDSGHWLELNYTYPVLPGTTDLRLAGSTRWFQVTLAEGETKTLEARSVMVHLECSPWEWTCLGKKDISLFLGDQPYPFVESVSDTPILFFGGEEPVWMQIDGSRNIRYRLPAKERDAEFHVGYVKLIPEPTHKPGQVTDLIRVEAIRQPADGTTLDIDLERPTVMPLVAGWYHLAHFVSLSHTEGARDKSTRGFQVVAGETVELRFRVFFTEKKLAAWQKREEQREKARAHTRETFKSRVLEAL